MGIDGHAARPGDAVDVTVKSPATRHELMVAKLESWTLGRSEESE